MQGSLVLGFMRLLDRRFFTPSLSIAGGLRSIELQVTKFNSVFYHTLFNFLID